MGAKLSDYEFRKQAPSDAIEGARLLPQRAFVPAVVALQVAESHVRGRAGLLPGVVVGLRLDRTAASLHRLE